MTRRFDAPAPLRSRDGSAWRAAGGLVATRFGLVSATFVSVTVASIAAVLILAAGAAVPVLLRQAFVASPVLVFVAPAASRADAEALGPKLTALPHVAGATLRRKEDALAALVATGLPAPTDGRNPLPDVWAVTLRGDGSFFTTEAVTVRDAITAFPGVDQVRYDDGWIAAVDAAAATWIRIGTATVAIGVTAIAAVVFCLDVLAGRALRGAGVGVSGAALAIVVAGVTVLAGLVNYAFWWSILGAATRAPSSLTKPIVDAIGLNLGAWVVVTALAGMVVAGAGIAVSGDRSKVSKS